MKDKTLTDVLLICKGWYNKKLYHSTLEALSAYYHKYYGCEDITVDKVFATPLAPSTSTSTNMLHDSSSSINKDELKKFVSRKLDDLRKELFYYIDNF